VLIALQNNSRLFYGTLGNESAMLLIVRNIVRNISNTFASVIGNLFLRFPSSIGKVDSLPARFNLTALSMGNEQQYRSIENLSCIEALLNYGGRRIAPITFLD
jgi:hypothetical protein